MMDDSGMEPSNPDSLVKTGDEDVDTHETEDLSIRVAHISTMTEEENFPDSDSSEEPVDSKAGVLKEMENDTDATEELSNHAYNDNVTDDEESTSKTCQIIVMNKDSDFSRVNKVDPKYLVHACDQCDESFRFPYQLGRHKRAVHEGIFPYTCEKCNKPFALLKSFKDHVKYVHSEKRKFTCKICNKAFKMERAVRQHTRIHHDMAERFQCEHCNKICPTKHALKKHFIVHSSDKPYKCDLCGKFFNREGNLKQHRLIHTAVNQFECQQCGKTFKRQYCLKVHMRNHLEVRPYKCDFCPSSFSQLHALKNHTRLHTGERPYKCKYCDRTFIQQGTLLCHEQRHNGEKKHKCPLCDRAFLLKRSLKEHIRTHTGEKPYACPYCPFRAALGNSVKLHIRNRHKGEPEGPIKLEPSECFSYLEGFGEEYAAIKKKEEGVVNESERKPKRKRNRKQNGPGKKKSNIQQKALLTENDADHSENGADLVSSVFEPSSYFQEVAPVDIDPQVLCGKNTSFETNETEDNQLQSSSISRENDIDPEHDSHRVSATEDNDHPATNSINVTEIENIASEILHKHFKDILIGFDERTVLEKMNLVAKELAVNIHSRINNIGNGSDTAKERDNGNLAGPGPRPAIFVKRHSLSSDGGSSTGVAENVNATKDFTPNLKGVVKQEPLDDTEEFEKNRNRASLVGNEQSNVSLGLPIITDAVSLNGQHNTGNSSQVLKNLLATNTNSHMTNFVINDDSIINFGQAKIETWKEFGNDLAQQNVPRRMLRDLLHYRQCSSLTQTPVTTRNPPSELQAKHSVLTSQLKATPTLMPSPKSQQDFFASNTLKQLVGFSQTKSVSNHSSIVGVAESSPTPKYVTSQRNTKVTKNTVGDSSVLKNMLETPLQTLMTGIETYPRVCLERIPSSMLNNVVKIKEEPIEYSEYG